ncbi:MAG: diacylglycerol kinase [Anaerosomatales bacterium]|nr:diacylglycerol kinase [Anaerosomatales bacterium]
MRSKSLLWSFNYAIEGIVYALKTQRNMRLHIAAAALVLVASLFFRIGRFEFIAVVFAITFVLVTELVNTALEAAIDVSTEGFDPVAKVAKDVAAGAVFVAAVNALVVGYIVFFTRLSSMADTLLVRVRQMPLHLTVVALGLSAIAVLVFKAITRTGTFMRGGWPSGHTALATTAATAIAYITDDASATVLAFFAAALVAQSRVESEVHSIWQVTWGAIVGALITTAVFQLFWF